MPPSTYTRNYTRKQPIVYVTRDIERALGMKPEGEYFIVSNETSYGKEVKKRYPKNILLIPVSEMGLADTFDLLALPAVEAFISEKKAVVVVFQNTLRIERLSLEKNWMLLNPSALLAQTVEEKISQVNWLEEDAFLLPPHWITTLENVSFEGKKFVIQFNHSHTGEGTHIITTSESLEALKKVFPKRECRIVDFIEGPVLTLNSVVGENIIIGNPSYQITGLAPFTDLPFGTIGNDWGLPQQDRYRKAYEDTLYIAKKVGKRLKKAGWRGLFGIDVIYDEKAQKTFLLEINARQPASAVFESTLQKKASLDGLSIFEAHIGALLGYEIETASTRIETGAQIVKRVTEKTFEVDVSALRGHGLSVTQYENSEHNKELFRIQSSESIMDSDNSFGVLGNFIRSCIK